MDDNEDGFERRQRRRILIDEEEENVLAAADDDEVVSNPDEVSIHKHSSVDKFPASGYRFSNICTRNNVIIS